MIDPTPTGKATEDVEFASRAARWRDEWKHLADGWVHPANRHQDVP